MKLAIVRGGGLAGIATTTRLHAAALPPKEAEKLEAKVRSSTLLSPQPEPPPAPSHPDDLLYEVTVDEGDKEHTARFNDENLPDEVRSLIEWVDARPESESGPGA
jgi:hypothetical protein